MTDTGIVDMKSNDVATRLPKLSPIGNKDRWLLTEDWTAFGFTVKKGFISDLDTIPRWLVGVYALLKGHARQSALLHDWLYFTEEVSRYDADRVFLLAMEHEQVSFWRRYVIYGAVRLVGWYRWNHKQIRV